MVRAGLSEEVTFVLKRMRSYQPEQKLTKGIADRGKSKCRGPEAKVCLVFSRKISEFRVPRAN